MANPAEHRYTYEEYLRLEEASDVKHEYFDGAVIAMAGGTPEHSLLKTNLTVAVANGLRGRPCRAFDSDLRSLVEATRFATYPDLAVVCGPFQRSSIDPDANVNPTVLFEVLSPGTAAYDLGEKFDQYSHMASLREYVCVASDRVSVRVHRREDGEWTLVRYGAGDVVELRSVEARVAVDDVYQGWEELRASQAR